MIKKYIVLSSYGGKSGLNELIDRVNQKIQDGWEPLGGICYSADYETDADDLYQAMVLR